MASCCRGYEKAGLRYHSYSCPNRATVPRRYAWWVEFRDGFFEGLGLATAVGLIVLMLKVV